VLRWEINKTQIFEKSNLFFFSFGDGVRAASSSTVAVAPPPSEIGVVNGRRWLQKCGGRPSGLLLQAVRVKIGQEGINRPKKYESWKTKDLIPSFIYKTAKSKKRRKKSSKKLNLLHFYDINNISKKITVVTFVRIGNVVASFTEMSSIAGYGPKNFDVDQALLQIIALIASAIVMNVEALKNKINYLKLNQSSKLICICIARFDRVKRD